MDNKVTKERFNNHLEYDWFKYIAFILVAVFLWIFVYSMLDKLKDYQKLDVFITVPFNDNQAEKFEADFIKYLSDMGDDTVKSVNFIYHDYSKNDTTFGQILQTSFTTYDLVIADEEAMRYLAAGERLVGFDYNFEFEYNIKKSKKTVTGSVFNGFNITQNQVQTVTEPYLAEEDFSAYYVFDQDQKDKYTQDFGEMFEIDDERMQKYILDYTFGIELNALATNLFFNYEDVLDEEGNSTGVKTKYYMGVILPNLSNSDGGGNKGVFNAIKQSFDYTHAWAAINYLKEFPIYYI